MSEIIRDDDVTIIELDPTYDSLDVDVLQRLADTLLQHVVQGPPPRLVLDMSKTTYINSSFIETVFRAWKRLKERGGQMALCCLHPFCHEVFEVTKLDKIWTICPTREAAIAAVRDAG